MKGLALVGLVLALVLGGCLDKESRKAHYLSEGERLLEQGDVERAKVAFKNVLQIDPKDARGHLGIAKVFEREGRVPEMVGHLRAAVEEAPDLLEPRLKLARIYLASRLIEEAEKLVAEIAQKDPHSSEGLVLQAMLAIAKEDKARARELVNKVLASQPTEPEALRVLALLDWQEGKRDQAFATLQQGIKANPQDEGLQVTYAELCLAHNRAEEALQTLIQLAQTYPEKFHYRLRVAQILVGLKREEEAIAQLREALKNAQDKKAVLVPLLQLQAKAKGPEGVIAELGRLIQEYPDDVDLRFQHVEALVQQKKLQEAKSVLEQISERFPKARLKAKVGVAELVWYEGKTEESHRLLEEVLKEEAQNPFALALRARLAMAEKKDLDSAISDLRAALGGQPKNIAFYQWLAQAHLQKGEFDLARETLAKAVELAPDHPQLRLRLASVMWHQKLHDAALKTLSQFLERHYDRQIATLACQWQIERQNYIEAERLAQLIIANEPQQGIGRFFLGLVYQAKGDKDQAAAAFEQALTENSKALEPLEALVRLWLADNRVDQAQARLQQLLKQYPDHYPAQYLLGEVFWRQKKTEQAIAAWQKARELQPTWGLPYWRLAQVRLEKGDVEGAIEQYRKAVEADPDNEQRYLDLALVLQRLGKVQEAVKTYEQALEKFPESLVLRNNLASILLDLNPDQKVFQRIESLVKPLEKEDKSPAFLDTLAWLRYRQGRLQEASAYIDKALTLDAQPIILYHQAKIAWDLGQKLKACASLAKAVEKAPQLAKAKEVEEFQLSCKPFSLQPQAAQ